MEINNNKVISSGTRFNELVDAFKKNNAEFYDYLTDLKEGWDGKRSEDFFSQLGPTSDFFNKTMDLMLKLADFKMVLPSVPDLYSSFDESFKNKKIDV